ncbi:uncharacterized protein LOC121247432 [Juglans microcarpa x Juglans regia]|uniref:uncharacterized protein LOC121247432 n=1 Tax=Juglans microcarpa x Juglans regia TaxID=2249226 RepID=UPI001B7DF8B6|nr:uncharacterized protein LOC121247432 [Juglans microcarpa x Juglans regia]
MGFVSFLGRVLFASLFILAAWKMYNEFGTDGGPAAKELAMKFAVLQKNLSSKLGVRVPDVDVRHLVAINIFMKVIGGVMFVFYSSYAAFLMLFNLALTTPILCDFYNYTPDEPNHHILLYEFLQSMALCGALLFFLGMKNSILKRQRKKKAPKTKTV